MLARRRMGTTHGGFASILQAMVERRQRAKAVLWGEEDVGSGVTLWGEEEARLQWIEGALRARSEVWRESGEIDGVSERARR